MELLCLAPYILQTCSAVKCVQAGPPFKEADFAAVEALACAIAGLQGVDAVAKLLEHFRTQTKHHVNIAAAEVVKTVSMAVQQVVDAMNKTAVSDALMAVRTDPLEEKAMRCGVGWPG